MKKCFKKGEHRAFLLSFHIRFFVTVVLTYWLIIMLQGKAYNCSMYTEKRINGDNFYSYNHRWSDTKLYYVSVAYITHHCGLYISCWSVWSYSFLASVWIHTLTAGIHSWSIDSYTRWTQWPNYTCEWFSTKNPGYFPSYISFELIWHPCNIWEARFSVSVLRGVCRYLQIIVPFQRGEKLNYIIEQTEIEWEGYFHCRDNNERNHWNLLQ